jgi:hypothetical protein
LVPNGRNLAVTEENKGEYIRLIAHHRMTSAIRSQIDSFLDGFYDLVPSELISIFTPTEIELLICGLPDVDVDDLAAHTDYHQYRESDRVIEWFWNVLRSFSREERALFLQFVTGTSKVCNQAIYKSFILELSYLLIFFVCNIISCYINFINIGSVGWLCKLTRNERQSKIFYTSCPR